MLVKFITEKSPDKRKSRLLKKAACLFLPTFGFALLLWFLSFFLHYLLGYLFLFVFITIIGYLIYQWFASFSKIEFWFEKVFKDIDFPPLIIRMRNAGFDLVFIFLLLAMVMDPIKDILAMERPQYSINYLFLDLAI